MKTLVLATLLVAVPLLALAPVAEAGPDCMPVYQEYTIASPAPGVEDITIVQRSSCGPVEVYYGGQNILY